MKIMWILLIWIVLIFFAVLDTLGLNVIYPMPPELMLFVAFIFGGIYGVFAGHFSRNILDSKNF